MTLHVCGNGIAFAHQNSQARQAEGKVIPRALFQELDLCPAEQWGIHGQLPPVFTLHRQAGAAESQAARASRRGFLATKAQVGHSRGHPTTGCADSWDSS